MFSLRYGKRPLVEEAQIISAGTCVRNFLLDLKGSSAYKPFDLNKEEDIKEIISRIEMGTFFNLKQERNGEEVQTDWNKVKMTYTRSNLGKGFIFWFMCNLCGRRAKFLYFAPNSTILACRVCHKLAYEKQSESASIRRLHRLYGL